MASLRALFHQRKQFLLALALAGVILAAVVLQSWAQSRTAGETAGALTAANAPAAAQSDLANCRYGVGMLYSSQTMPWLATLGAGWYVAFNPKRPGVAPANNAEYVYTLRMKGGVFDPPLSSITTDLQNYPGSLWLVGSEQEVDHPETGDKTFPDDYAEAYHEAYNFIKQRDPSAQVAIGGMSMATPGRLQYLDKVWAAYKNKYGRDMPVDAWNVHLYIFAEREWNSTEPYHGKIALGTDPYLATQHPGNDKKRCSRDDVYCKKEHDSFEIFKDQLTELRKWMKNHGQQDKPLILTEFSLLYQPGYKDEDGNGFPPSRVNAYMNKVTDYLENTKDTSLGYPQDDYRLVQQWLWYSIYTQSGWSGYASNLLKNNYANYEAGSKSAFTEVGNNYYNIIHGQGQKVNLKAGRTSAAHVGPGTAELRLEFVNNGNTRIERAFQVTFYADAGLTQRIGAVDIAPAVNGCARNTYTAAVNWNNLSQGVHSYWAKVDSGNAISESNETNSDNVIGGSVTIGSGSGASPTPTNTAVAQPTSTATATPTPKPQTTATATAIPTATATSSPTPRATATVSPTATATSLPTNTPQPGATATPTATATSSPTPTATVLPTATATYTPVPDTQPPTVSWTAPVGNEQIYTFAGETVQLEVAASDDVAIADVHFYRWDAADETWRLLGVAQSAPFRRNLDTSTLADEWNQIVALAYDTAGNESAHVHIWLRRQSDEPQPTITPTQPPTATPTITPTATATPLPTATPLATADAPTPPYRAYLPLLR